MKKYLIALLSIALLSPWVGSAPPTEAAQSPPGAWHFGSARHLDKQRALDAYMKMPLYFIVNQGQVDERVGYYAQGNGHSIYFTAEEVVVALDETTLRMRFVGAEATLPLGAERTEAKVNYFIGNDPAQWQTNVPTYGEVVYRDLYPGIDLRYEGQTGALKYTFEAQPGADVSQIRLAYGGAAGLRLDEEGNLLILAGGSELKDTKPYAYQEIGGRRVEVDVTFVLHGVRTYGFAVQGDYDPRYPLTIDPTLVYSTYLGGSGDDYGNGIAVDGTGHAYVTGDTDSNNFPTTAGVFDATYGGGVCSPARPCKDAFVAKIDTTQSGTASLIYSTYLGGSGDSSDDSGYGIAVDGTGNAYVTGETWSTDFPTQNAYQGDQGGIDAFVTKLNAAGNALLYSTYLGGGGSDWGNGIAVDGASHAYVTGRTYSTDFPTQNAYQGTCGGCTTDSDAFVTRIDTMQSGVASLIYSTYLGGSADDYAKDIAVDGASHAYVTGRADSNDFPTQNAYQGNQGGIDAFVTKIDPTQSGAASLLCSTYLGGDSFDEGYGIAVDGAGNAYVTGETWSDDFPTQNPYDNSLGGSKDAFVTKLNAAGNALVYSTYLGGSDYDSGRSIAVDGVGQAYVAGRTYSTDFPTTAGAFDTTCGTDGNCDFDGFVRYLDAFVVKVSTSGTGLVNSTYLGGSGEDGGGGIAVDGAGNTYVTGYTESTDFPAQNAYQGDQGGDDAFVTRLSVPLYIGKSGFPDPVLPGGLITYTITVTETGGISDTTGVQVTDTVPANTTCCASIGQGGALVGNDVVWTGKTVPKASSLDLTFVVTVGQVPSGTIITNDAYRVVTSTLGVTTCLGSAVNTTVKKPALSIGKSDFPDPVAPGGLLTYTITVAETDGIFDATGVQVTDTVPVSTTCCAAIGQGGTLVGNDVVWSDKTVPKGSSIDLTFAVTVNQVPSGTIITNDRYRVVTSTLGVTTGLGSAVTTRVSTESEGPPTVYLPLIWKSDGTTP